MALAMSCPPCSGWKQSAAAELQEGNPTICGNVAALAACRHVNQDRGSHQGNHTACLLIQREEAGSMWQCEAAQGAGGPFLADMLSNSSVIADQCN